MTALSAYQRLRDEKGAVTAFVAVLAAALIVVAGMAYDGGQVVAAYSTARSDAAKAARAAAQEVDLTVLRQGGGPVLDPTAAEAAAQDYLARVGATGEVTVDGNTVTVTVTAVQPMRILPLPDRTIVATEAATAVDGETTGAAGSDVGP